MTLMATVLLVEDDERLRVLAFKVLGRQGYRLLLAGDGVEAVRMAAEERPDLVLMDLTLPQMDGLEATRRIKQADPRTRVVMLTAHAMVGDRERAAEAGCDGFLSKPYAIGDLVACVEHHLGAKPAPTT